MRTIEMESWARRAHFEFYNSFNHPHFNLCANLDITAFLQYQKQNQISFTIALIYLLTRTANSIPEFRYRIRGEEVVEHEVIHHSTTIMSEDNLFTFGLLIYCDNFGQFAQLAQQRIEYVQAHPILDKMPGKDDLVYSTAIPWVSFTSFMHPMQLHPEDSIPRLAWGKYYQERRKVLLPLSVQGHHALMDGVHVGIFFNRMQEYMHQPQILSGD